MRPIIFLVLIALCSSAAADDTVQAKLPGQKILSSPTGRYVFGQVSDFRADQFLLDTQTGRMWQIVVDKEGVKKLQPLPIIQIAYVMDLFAPETASEVEAFKSYMIDQAKIKPKKAEESAPATPPQ